MVIPAAHRRHTRTHAKPTVVKTSLSAFVALILLFVSPHAIADSNRLRVAAAADLKFALEDIRIQFLRAHASENRDAQIEIVTGSSGQFEQQIEQGAPFDLFLSADTTYPQKLADKKLTVGAPQPYAVGRLVLWAKSAKAVSGLSSLEASEVRKIAIANPAHAPYGRLALEALKKSKAWPRLESKLVFGDSVSQAGQFALSGAADVGLIALALAKSEAFSKEGHFVLIPEASPLQQSLVILKPSRLASDFTSYIVGKDGQEILARYGLKGTP